MKRNEGGFTYVELLVAITIIVVVSGAAGLAIFQVFKNTERNNDYITVVRQVQNAGYWISRDARTAQNIKTDNLTPPNFLVMNWTEWDEAGNPIYHSATYFFDGLTQGIGKLKRTHWSSAGASEQTLVANYIYYDPGDPAETSQASYQNPALTVQLTARLKENRETREYQIYHRPNL